MKLTDFIRTNRKEDRNIKHPLYKWSRYFAGLLAIFFAIVTFGLVYLIDRAGLETRWVTFTGPASGLCWAWTQVVVEMKKRGMIE